jgi:DNA-binding NarL/FixJ family response regulator
VSAPLPPQVPSPAADTGLTVVLLQPGDQDDVWHRRLAEHLRGADGIGAVLRRPDDLPCVVGTTAALVQVLHLRLDPDGGCPTRGLSLARERAGSGGVVVTAAHGTLAQVGELFAVGVRGFVFSDSPREEVVTAVRAVAAGHPFVPPALLRGVRELAPRQRRGDAGGAGPVVPLTEREADVLRQMALGRSNAQVAQRLFIAPATVRTHVLSILRKLGARNRTEAVVRAYRAGLLDMDVLELDLDAGRADRRAEVRQC